MMHHVSHKNPDEVGCRDDDLQHIMRNSLALLLLAVLGFIDLLGCLPPNLGLEC